MTNHDEMTRRLERQEQACTEQTKVCRETFTSLTSSLTKGNVRFAAQEEVLKNLQTTLTGDGGVCSRLGRLEGRIQKLEISMVTTTNRILSGLAIACVLLAINAVIAWAGNGQ